MRSRRWDQVRVLAGSSAVALAVLASAAPPSAPLGPRPIAAQVVEGASSRDASALPRSAPRDVPFVAQGRLLCGAAALAMVRRAWGARDVHPGDWAHLVRPDEGGIRTGDLSRAAATGRDGRRWRVYAASLEGPDELHRLLARGPVIALVEDRPGVYHYVVVLSAGAEEIRLHDPAAGPDRRHAAADFDRVWGAAGRWALLALPPEEAAPDPDVPPPPPSTPRVRRAGELFRSGRYGEAAEAAGSAAPRLRAASLYLAGREDEALAAWGALGEARLDHVRVEGLGRTRHPVALGRLGLPVRAPLREGGLIRARRRLEALPSVAAARVSWRPLEGGRLTEVRAAVVERPSRPGAAVWALAALRALATGGSSLSAGLTGAGEVARLDGRWTGPRRSAGFSVAAPGVAHLPGVTTLELRGVREAHPGGVETLTRLRLGVEDWTTATLRWGAALTLEEWGDGRPRPGLAASVGVRDPGDRVDLGLRVRGAGGPGGPWAKAGVAAAFRGGDGGGLSWRGAIRLEAVTGDAPRTSVPGAGTGRVRGALLRAHDLGSSGVVAGPSIAPRLAGGTLEVVRWIGGSGPLRVGLAAFVDGALPSGGPSDGLLVDSGGGLRIGLAGLPGSLRLDAAVGLTDDARAVSAGWSPGWPGLR